MNFVIFLKIILYIKKSGITVTVLFLGVKLQNMRHHKDQKNYHKQGKKIMDDLVEN